MFKKLRRYLLFLCMFTFATTNIADLGVLIEDEALEAASIHELPEQESSDNQNQIEASDEQEIPYQLQIALPLGESFETSGEEKREDSQEEPQIQDTSLESVSFYIHTYQKLPPVYISKQEAYRRGWFDGELGEMSNGKCIGGDYFGNYQGILPQKRGRSYRECDIDAIGTERRGRKRIVYSNDGLMYYTEDHYETFTLLYSNWNSKTADIL